MIDLTQLPTNLWQMQTVQTDPGRSWVKDAQWAIDAPPDEALNPQPDAGWPTEALRTGVCGSVTPRVLELPESGYRMYYTQILPRPGFPAGANDYENSTTRILSANSLDGSTWTPESGTRLSSQDGGAGEFRVVCGDVVPRADAPGQLRMYYECCPGPLSQPNSILSAVSENGLAWKPEPGERLSGGRFASPRIIFLDERRCRLYCCQRGLGIISALSVDGGLTFVEEPDVRIDQSGADDSLTAFAPEIMRVSDGGYIMYYAGYCAPNRASILRAVSDDGLTWQKEEGSVIAPGGTWDGAKCSEMCLFRLPQIEGQAQRYRIVYECCDGTAKNERGVWRIASATSAV